MLLQYRCILQVGYNELLEKYRELEEAKHSLESRHYQLQTALEQERNARTDSSELIKELESEYMRVQFQ